MNKDNVIQLPAREEGFDEKIGKLVKDVKAAKLPPDEELARDLYLATMEGDDQKRAEIKDLIRRKKEARITIIK